MKVHTFHFKRWLSCHALKVLWSKIYLTLWMHPFIFDIHAVGKKTFFSLYILLHGKQIFFCVTIWMLLRKKWCSDLFVDKYVFYAGKSNSYKYSLLMTTIPWWIRLFLMFSCFELFFFTAVKFLYLKASLLGDKETAFFWN